MHAGGLNKYFCWKGKCRSWVLEMVPFKRCTSYASRGPCRKHMIHQLWKMGGYLEVQRCPVCLLPAKQMQRAIFDSWTLMRSRFPQLSDFLRLIPTGVHVEAPTDLGQGDSCTSGDLITGSGEGTSSFLIFLAEETVALDCRFISHSWHRGGGWKTVQEEVSIV